MTSDLNLDRVRLAALDDVDKAERSFKRAMVATAAVEGILLVVFFFLMDFSDRLHWLLLVSAVLVYSTVGVGLVALGVKNRVNTLKILKAIELLNGRQH